MGASSPELVPTGDGLRTVLILARRYMKYALRRFDVCFSDPERIRRAEITAADLVARLRRSDVAYPDGWPIGIVNALIRLHGWESGYEVDYCRLVGDKSDPLDELKANIDNIYDEIDCMIQKSRRPEDIQSMRNRPFEIDPAAFYDRATLNRDCGFHFTAIERARKSGELRSTRRGGRTLFLGRWVFDWLTAGDPPEEALRGEDARDLRGG